jgi:phosphoglycerol geranylgeranyltransferase
LLHNIDVKKTVDIPLIVGGGIRSIEDATKTSRAGANIIVTGTILEQGKSLKPIIDAIKQ